MLRSWNASRIRPCFANCSYQLILNLLLQFSPLGAVDIFHLIARRRVVDHVARGGPHKAVEYNDPDPARSGGVQRPAADRRNNAPSHRHTLADRQRCAPRPHHCPVLRTFVHRARHGVFLLRRGEAIHRFDERRHEVDAGADRVWAHAALRQRADHHARFELIDEHQSGAQRQQRHAADQQHGHRQYRNLGRPPLRAHRDDVEHVQPQADQQRPPGDA